MILVDIFTFKDKIRGILSPENVKDLLGRARELIIDQARQNYPGPEKKKVVDAVITSFIENKVSGCSNKLVLWVIDLIIKAIPTLTQAIYDYLKERVENL